MRRLLKGIYKTVLPVELRERLDLFSGLRTRNHGEEILPRGRIVVFAPHPDDEVLGCGGTILRCRAAGAEVVVVFMTDGACGHGGTDCDTIVDVRKDEARRAGKLLDVAEPVFLDHPDGKIAADTGTVREMAGLLERYRPDAVFLPCITDQHRDHVITNLIFRRAARNLPSLWCFGYVVWTPMPFTNLNVDVTDFIERKKEALREYRSQLDIYDYLEANIGLNRYNSMGSEKKGSGYAEVFLACSSPEYCRLVDLFGEGAPTE